MSVMLQLPAFLAAFAVMYWSLPLACLSYRLRFLNFTKKRDDIFRWSEFLVDFFGARLYKVGDEELFRSDEPVLYLHNHRCWADFFLDVYTTEGRAAPLSRWAVFPVFPVFLASALTLRAILLFKRNISHDRDQFNQWLERNVLASACSGLIVYPEGHRSLRPESLPLKRGMLHFAFSRKWPVQIVMTKGKEQLLCEKRLSVGFNAALVFGYSAVIHSADFDTCEAFMARVAEVWAAKWAQIYGAAPSGEPVRLGAQGGIGASYLPITIIQQSCICLMSVVLLVLLVLMTLQLVASSAWLATLGLLVAATTAVSLRASVIKPVSQKH